MIHLFNNCNYVSLMDVVKTIKKNSDWLYNLMDDEYKGEYLNLEKTKKDRVYLNLNRTIKALLKSVIKGDMLSFDLLLELKAECVKKNLRIPQDLEEIEIYNIYLHFTNWVNFLKNNYEIPVVYTREESRLRFINWVNVKTSIGFNVNKSFFSKIVDRAKAEGLPINRNATVVKSSWRRVYSFW